MLTFGKPVLAGITWLLLVGSLIGCTVPDKTPAKSDQEQIVGTVWYRERMLLPPNAEIYVALEDVSRMDVAADVIADTRFTPKGGPPWDFSLAYDPARINARGRYAMRARIEVEGRLMFINTRHIPTFDQEPGTPLKIMVSRTAMTAKPAKPNADLVNTYWKLTELNGKPATLGAGKKELHLVLELEKNTVRGFSGCNRFSGTYQKNTNKLKFGPMAATMMACMEGMEQEQAFLKALGRTERYAIKGNSLSLYSDDEKLIPRFEAVYLK